jgi:chromosome segregation ATPase
MDKSLALEGEAAAGGAVSTAEFEKVMVNIGFDPALSAFKGEYARLLSALKGSLSSEKRLVAKIGALNEEIVLNAGKVTQALRLAEEDGATIDDLRKQLERAWAMVEASNTRAEAAGQSAQGFQAEAAQLKAELGKMHELLAGDSIEELAAARDNLGSRLDTATASLAAEKARGDGLVAELEARSQKLNQRRDEVRALRGELTLKSAEEAKTSRMVAALQADVARAKEEAEGRAAAEAGARAARGELEATIARLQKGLEAQRASTASALAEASEGAARARKLTEELRGLMDRASAAGEAKAALERELKEAREGGARERAGAAKLAAKLEAAGKEVAAAQAAGAAAGLELTRLRSELAALGKSLSAEQGAVREKEAAAARLERERASAQARVAAGQAALGEAEVEAARRDAELRAAGEQVRELTAGAKKMAMVVGSLQRAVEGERAGAEAARGAAAAAGEAAAVKEAMVLELEAREREGALKLRALQAAFEAMRGERNAARKAAAEGEEEAAELARRERIAASHIAQLKDEVMAKDKFLVTEQFEVASLGKRLSARTGECEKLRALLAEASASVRLQGDDLARCKGLLRSADEDSLAQKRAYDSLVCERDALTAQVKSRNDDLALARDRLGIMEVALGKGEKAYQARELEIKALKLKVRGKGAARRGREGEEGGAQHA